MLIMFDTNVNWLIGKIDVKSCLNRWIREKNLCAGKYLIPGCCWTYIDYPFDNISFSGKTTVYFIGGPPFFTCVKFNLVSYAEARHLLTILADFFFAYNFSRIGVARAMVVSFSDRKVWIWFEWLKNSYSSVIPSSRHLY